MGKPFVATDCNRAAVTFTKATAFGPRLRKQVLFLCRVMARNPLGSEGSRAEVQMKPFAHLPDRDAYATVRGSVYQVNLTILRWLDLTQGQSLELESCSSAIPPTPPSARREDSQATNCPTLGWRRVLRRDAELRRKTWDQRDSSSSRMRLSPDAYKQAA
jgi:hypothetical protein